MRRRGISPDVELSALAFASRRSRADGSFVVLDTRGGHGGGAAGRLVR